MAAKNVVEQVARPLCSNLSVWSRKACVTLAASFSLMFMVFGTVAFAATYYVSPNGSDGNNGSSGAPFRTIQKAANVVNAGDIVIVKNGTYTGGTIVVNMARGGTASGWITFKSENQWGAVIDGQNNSSDYCINFTSNANYVRIEDFEIRGCGYAGVLSNESAHDVYIFNNKIHDIADGIVVPESPTGSVGRGGVFQGASTSYHTYDSNIFYTIGRTPNDPPIYQDYGHDHGIYIRGTNSKIFNNVFWDMHAGYPIQVAPEVDTLDIVNNTFIAGNPERDSGILLWNGTNINIENNIFANFNSFGVECFIYTTSNITSRNNLSTNAITDNYCTSHSGFSASGDINNADPFFVNSTSHDYHLQSGSPAIGRGIAYAARIYDAAGNAINGTPDIGAYEYEAVNASAAAAPAADTTAPTTPAGLTATAISSTQISLSWTPSTDNVGVAGYRVYRNGTQIATAAGTSYADAGLLASTNYTYAVSAYDAAGNSSGRSASVLSSTGAVSVTNRCTATLSSDLILHIPASTLNGAYLWGDAVCNTAADGTIFCRVTDYGDANPNDFRNCVAGWISPDLSTMHLTSVLYENKYYWGDLLFVPTADGSIWLKVAAYGQN